MELCLHAVDSDYCGYCTDRYNQANVPAEPENSEKYWAAELALKKFVRVFMLNNKGQEEAPFELLIAVITMGFVLMIAIVAMNALNAEKCKNETEAKLEEFKTMIETVVNQKTPKTVDFTSHCYNPKDERIKIQKYFDPGICTDYCASGGHLCSLLEYSNSEAGVYFKKCLNINPDTVFVEQAEATPTTCPDLEESEQKLLVNFWDVIPRGIFEMNNPTGSGEVFPTICAYCKKRTGTCG
ncbi:MAG: hypothetical protein JW772_01610 [Candidatus Diapherotrites archaeon]|nr:hypothetical protein [Candidatus Diapherotrites archaeon]